MENVKHLCRTGLFFVTRPGLPPKKFLIFSRGRSGSTLLVDLLNTHSCVRCDNEIFYQGFLFPRRRVDVRASMSRTEVYGFKLITYQLQAFQKAQRPEQFIRYLYEHGYKIIYLTRTNLLRYALSNIYARKVRFHHNVSEGSPERRAIHVEVEDVLSWIEEAKLRESYELRVLQDIPRLSLTYEEHLRDSESQQKTVAKVCDFIGIPSEPVSTRMQKVTARTLRDLVINYEALSEALSDTPYARFLSDGL
jgi:LPS sulfotransferase NodH